MKCDKMRKVWPPNKPLMKRPFLVGCGKCLPCLHNKRKDWVFRLTHEYRCSSSAMFVTLTYHPKFLPDGLSKDHVQKYIKRLRKACPDSRIRYYLVGEYGSKNGRPHYHILLFNAPPDGEAVRKAWVLSEQSIGIVDIRPVNEARINYTLKYMLQPELVFKDLPKPFVLMSRGYGIGMGYLTEEMVKWHREDDRNFAVVDNEITALPRFYKEKIWYRVKKDYVSQGVIYPRAIVIEHPRREWVSLKSKLHAKRSATKNMNFFIKKFNDRAAMKYKEHRDAMISRIRVKVAYTQIF